MIRRLALAVVAAWLVMGAVILGRFADEPLPAWYVLRPLIVAAGAAALVGAGSLIAGRHAVLVAAGVALAAALTDPAIILTLAALAIAVELLRRRGRPPVDTHLPALVLAVVFFSVGLVRALSVMDLPTSAGYESSGGGPPMYVILLDGYPRLDTLGTLGIDNSAFVDSLEGRGFDVYPDAHSIHTRTNKTLLAMLTEEEVNDDPVSVEERRDIRQRLIVPPGFVAVDPPVGYVTLGPGPHIHADGPNDFEAQLAAQSVLGVVFPDWTWEWLIRGLRHELAATLDLVASTSERRIFMHLMAPHPPFLYGPDGSSEVARECWPSCGLFVDSMQDLGISREEWADRMAAQLAGLNPRLLDAVDRIVGRDPGAVIVMFSDHGSRFDDADPDERHRSFLAARTPGRPDLFADAPRPDAVIRTLLDGYAP